MLSRTIDAVKNKIVLRYALIAGLDVATCNGVRAFAYPCQPPRGIAVESQNAIR